MKNEFTLKKLTKIDSGIVKDIAGLLPQLDKESSTAVTKELLDTVIKSPTTKVFVAQDSAGKTIGMVTMISYRKIEGKSKAWIEDLVVDSAYRGKGIGKALMLRAMDEAKKSDVRVVYLTSRPHRTTAHALYREIGFKVVNTNCFKFELA